MRWLGHTRRMRNACILKDTVEKICHLQGEKSFVSNMFTNTAEKTDFIKPAASETDVLYRNCWRIPVKAVSQSTEKWKRRETGTKTEVRSSNTRRALFDIHRTLFQNRFFAT